MRHRANRRERRGSRAKSGWRKRLQAGSLISTPPLGTGRRLRGLTIGKLRDELAVEHGLDLDLSSEVQLTVRLSLLRSRVPEAIGLSSARLVPLLADLSERSRVELDVGLFTGSFVSTVVVGR